MTVAIKDDMASGQLCNGGKDSAFFSSDGGRRVSLGPALASIFEETHHCGNSRRGETEAEKTLRKRIEAEQKGSQILESRSMRHKRGPHLEPMTVWVMQPPVGTKKQMQARHLMIALINYESVDPRKRRGGTLLYNHRGRRRECNGCS